MNYLLDTNILSAILKADPRLSSKYHQVQQQQDRLLISCITYCEIEGGLLAIQSQKKLAILENLCQNEIEVLFLDQMNIIHTASRIYANLRRKGTPIQFADILIAATALEQDLTLVSHDSDMLRIEGLKLEDWLQTGV